MSNGLHGALLEYQREGNNAMSVVLEGFVNSTLAEDTMNATTLEQVLSFLDTMTSSYLSDGLTDSADMYYATANSSFTVYASWLIGLCVRVPSPVLCFFECV